MKPTTLACNSPENAPASDGRPRTRRKSAALCALVALNVLLAVVFVNRQTPDNTARAQARPSDFLMVPGTVTGVSTGVIFIVDTSTGQLSAITYNDTRDAVVPLPKIDLNQVFKAGAGVGAAGVGGVKPPKIR